MSIRFKFRSAASYDVVDIGQRESITVKELKAKIIKQKNLDRCHDFDLVFSDGVSGREYNRDEFDIPSGASVIIKRIPSAKAPLAVAPVDKVENFAESESHFLYPACTPMDDFDDFGADLSRLPDATCPGFDPLSDKKARNNENTDLAGSRPGVQKLGSSDLSQTMPKEAGYNHIENERDLPQRPKVDEQMKLERLNQVMQSIELPSELSCLLCNKYFKDAVMIPCCQHSFCKKCITTVLVEEARCPKCFSTKCKVENLLPNLSLQHAIEHFLESQMITDGDENDLCKYVPDGESGIQAKEVSCAVTVIQREPELPHSPTATGKGSNQILSPSFYESVIRKNTPFGSSEYCVNNFGGDAAMNSACQKKAKHYWEGSGYAHHLNAENGHEDLAPLANSFRDNQPLNLPQSHMHDEADSTMKKNRGLWVGIGGGDPRLLPAGRQKVERTCYMCGSPDHFIKDCPVASAAYPVPQAGNYLPGGGMPSYISPYWNGTMLTPFRPFMNMCGNSGMMPYSPSMVPVVPFAIPPYATATYGGLSGPGGNIGMRSIAPLNYPEYMELQHSNKRMKLLDENSDRGQYLNGEDEFRERYQYNSVPQKSDDRKVLRKRECSGSYSKDSSSGRLRRKRQHEKYDESNSHAIDQRYEKVSRSSLVGRGRKSQPSERLNSEIEHKRRSSDRGSEEGHRLHSRSSKRHGRRGQSGSESSQSRHYQTRNGVRRPEPDARGSHHKYNSYYNSGLGPSTASDKKLGAKERYSDHKFVHTRHDVKHRSDERRDDRWKTLKL